MKLGTYVEIRTRAADIAAGLDFYTRLGFQKIGDALLTDGSINLRLSAESGPSPLLVYRGGDLGAVARSLGQTPPAEAEVITFTSPDGLAVSVSARSSEAPMPAGDPMSRAPLSRLGKFGEFSMAVSDLGLSAAFWEQRGFSALYQAAEPYPWGIFSDGLILLGLHQNPETYPPTLTYFAGDMPDRIRQFQAEGLAIIPVMPGEDGAVANARFIAPDQQQIFIFHGEI